MFVFLMENQMHAFSKTSKTFSLSIHLNMYLYKCIGHKLHVCFLFLLVIHCDCYCCQFWAELMAQLTNTCRKRKRRKSMIAFSILFVLCEKSWQVQLIGLILEPLNVVHHLSFFFFFSFTFVLMKTLLLFLCSYLRKRWYCF